MRSPIRPRPIADDLADRIGQRRDLRECPPAMTASRFSFKRQPIEHRVAQAIRSALLDIARIGHENFRLRRENLICHGQQAGILLRRR
jgi:hypothetical protein